MKKDATQIFIKRIIFSPLFLILLLIISLIFLTSTLKIYFQSKKIYAERKEKEKELRLEEEKNKEILRKIGRVETTEGIEKNLRENLQVRKSGEKVAIIYSPKNQSNGEDKNSKKFFNKILNPVRNFISNGADWWLGR